MMSSSPSPFRSPMFTPADVSPLSSSSSTRSKERSDGAWAIAIERKKTHPARNFIAPPGPLWHAGAALCRRSPRFRRLRTQTLAKLERIGRREPFSIIIEVDPGLIDGPGANFRGPLVQRILRVSSLILCAGAMQPDVRKVGRCHQGRDEACKIVHAESCTMLVQQLVDRIRVPSGIPELERVAMPARQRIEEFSEAVQVRAPTRWKLKNDRPELSPEQVCALEELR